MKIFSIIIPFKNNTSTLKRLFDSIPKSDSIEILLIENSDSPLTREQIGIDREYILLNAKSSRYAGGARNVGVNHASGKWLIFADSDDFFSEQAFDVFNEYSNTEYDLIYFGCSSVYDDSLLPSDRHLSHMKILEDFQLGNVDEVYTKFYIVAPWAKMIKKEVVTENQIEFDEVIAANDIMFSTKVAFHSKCFHVDMRAAYIVTTRKGSLAHSWNEQILTSRFLVGIERNNFLKRNGYSELQVSIMVYLYRAFKNNFFLFLKFLFITIVNKQNIFIGYKNWFVTMKNIKKDENNKSKYIVND